MTVLMYLFILVGAVFLIVQVTLLFAGHLSYNDIFGVVISCAFLMFGWYFSKRIAMITSLDEDAITLISRKRRVDLHGKDVISVSKMVCFTFSERGWFIIHFINDKGKKERWMFQSEPSIRLVDNLGKMHIRMRNIP
jgi:Ca2+/Na+ antiporter